MSDDHPSVCTSANAACQDLSYLNRPLRKVLIIDTDAHHVKHQPENAIILPKWNGDPNDQTLVQLIPFLEYLATMGFDDTRPVLKSFDGTFIPAEFARREKLLREKFYEKRQAEGKHRKKPSVAGVAGALGWKSNKPQLIDPSTGKPIKEEPLDGDKMLWDQIRERGQAQYMAFEKQIREEGEKWLSERAAEEKKLQDEAMKNMKGGILGYFGMGGGEKQCYGGNAGEKLEEWK
jgi:import inner membrane translocase subunit TIM50